MENKNYDPAAPVARLTEPTREMCEAMPVLPALTQDDLRFKALGWPMHAIQNRHRLIAALAVAPASPRALDVPVITIKPMKLSGGRTDYYVSIRVGDREVTPYKFSEEWKAAYEVANFKWLLNGDEKPDLMAFGPAALAKGSK